MPANLGSIAAGAEELVVARLTQARVQGDVVLRGEVAGEAFERHFTVELVAEPGEANAFVPRLYASVAIAELEASMDEGARRRSIELSTRYNVASRYTSLLVLESPAMFAAFGLDNRRGAPEWTGELESQKSESAGEGAERRGGARRRELRGQRRPRRTGVRPVLRARCTPGGELRRARRGLIGAGASALAAERVAAPGRAG